MAAVQRQKIRGSAPKVRNSTRTKGFWVGLAKARANKKRVLPTRNWKQGINYPELSHVGSAAYRRMNSP